MRVLILSAVLACAVAAPQGYYLVGVVPTVPPGDVQAAVIDTQVKINDQVQQIVDQSRELSEIAAERQTEGINEGTDLVKEQAEEATWAAEEKKWQELNAAQIAQAQLEAAAASQVEPEALGDMMMKESEEKSSEDMSADKNDAVAVEPMVKSEELKPEPAVGPPKLEGMASAAENAPAAPEATVKTEDAVKIEAAEMKDEKKNEGIAMQPVVALAPEARQYFPSIGIIPSSVALKSPIVAPIALAPSVWGTYPVSAIQYLGGPILSPLK